MLKGFRDFILRGNVLDLAVGVIIGAAFGAVVASLAEDVLTPLIGAIFGQPDFSELTLGPIRVGNLLNALITFLITAFALYFFVVTPVNAALTRIKKDEPAPEVVQTDETKLLIEIRDLIKAGAPLTSGVPRQPGSQE
jgi:large conductance mechanosensitive channel